MRLNIDKPNIKGEDIESLRKSINLYLTNFSEAVSTMLGNIDNDNLSATLSRLVKQVDERTDALTINMLDIEARMGSSKNSIEIGEGYFRLGGRLQVCFGGLTAQSTTFPKEFKAAPSVVFNTNSYSSVISSVTSTGFNLNTKPNSGSYIAIGAYV